MDPRLASRGATRLLQLSWSPSYTTTHLEMATLITLPTTLPTHELGFAPAADAEHQVQAVAQAWLTQLEVASTTRDGQAFANLFVQETDGFWRDILAFTNDYRTIRGTEKIAQAASVREH